MKQLFFLLAILIYGTAAASPFFNWNLLWSGSWEEKTSALQDDPALTGTLHNRGEMRLFLLPPGLMLRTQVLDRHALDFSQDTAEWVVPDKGVTHFTGGLYHRQTGSRLLFGVLDEWGLSARIRNPWIRSPPYPENHKPIMADLKTAASSAKEDEVYLYLSSTQLQILPNTKLRGFVSAQTGIENISSAFSGGLNLSLPNKKEILMETFYTGKTLPPSKNSTWFPDPPPLPERDFHLYAGGFLFTCPAFSVSSDLALSDTFAWGSDIYCNLGLTVTPLLPFGTRPRPLAFSLAFDGSGERFVNRDGGNLKEGFRGAGKIELKGKYNALLRLNSVLRSPGLGEDLNRSSTGFYCRFPVSRRKDSFPVRLTRISLSADRNAENPLKINDSFSGTVGIGLYSLGIAVSGSIKGEAQTLGGASELKPNLFPVPFSRKDEQWNKDSSAINCELFWSYKKLQLRSRVGVSFYANKDDIWDLSLSGAIRFKPGRLSLKVASPEFPEKWNWSLSWRLEKR